ncbi:hypothetical protein Syun_010731 [Stephania yunnanensis]|uniref:Bromodomain associated domain-containing protein n=1 Tax=Stephania yunnanensis TaxID=152371 RepID=A0AAP0PQ84_9MAGN
MGDSQIFYSAIARIAAAQICQSVGFTGSQSKALDAVANILTRHLQTLARSASSNANSSRRTHSNAFDLIHAIEQANSIHGFRGSSNPHRPFSRSGIVKDLVQFVQSIDEIPFAQPLPRTKRSGFSRRRGQSNGDGRRCGSHSHVPPWAPEFPDPSTCGEGARRSVCGGGDQLRGFCVEEETRAVDDRFVEHRDPEIRIDKQMMKFLPIERQRVRFKMVKELSAKRGEINTAKRPKPQQSSNPKQSPTDSEECNTRHEKHTANYQEPITAIQRDYLQIRNITGDQLVSVQ